MSILKLKNNSSELMLEIKKASDKYGLTFMTDDKENLVNCLSELCQQSDTNWLSLASSTSVLVQWRENGRQ